MLKDIDLLSGHTTTIDNSIFMQRCVQRTITKEELKLFLVQHFHYSRHFTRYLCALIANLVREEDRFHLSVNLFEEMGLGDMGDTPHTQIYQQMLDRMNIDPLSQPILPATKELIKSMLYLCNNPDPMVGLGAIYLGAEAIVPQMYQNILDAFVHLGYKQDDFQFFSLHIAGDDEHADTMEKIVQREIKKDEKNSIALLEAAKLITLKRVSFFNAISETALQNQAKEIQYVG